MNPTYIPITTTGTYNFWPDYVQSPFNLSFAVELAGGTTGTYTVSYTLDDPQPQITNYGDTAWTPICSASSSWVNPAASRAARMRSLSAGFFFMAVSG